MGKNNGNYKDRMNEILESQRALDKQVRKMKVQCAHVNKNGKLKLTEVGNGYFECDICGERFSLAPIDRHTLDAAVEVIHNAAQTIRCYSDAEQDRNLIVAIGELDYNVRELPDIYEKVSSAYTRNQGGKKRNKNKNRNQGGGFGQFGAGNVSFLGR